MRYSRSSKHYLQLAAFLKERRLKKNLTIRQLAEILGVHHSIVGKIETGNRKLEVFELIDYCHALGIQKKELFALLDAITSTIPFTTNKD